MIPFCPVHYMTGRMCDSECLDNRRGFARYAAALEAYFKKQGYAEHPTRSTSRRRYDSRIVARRAHKVAA